MTLCNTHKPAIVKKCCVIRGRGTPESPWQHDYASAGQQGYREWSPFDHTHQGEYQKASTAKGQATRLSKQNGWTPEHTIVICQYTYPDSGARPIYRVSIWSKEQ